MSDDEVWSRSEIESPCVKICLIHPEARICIGCHRSADEIAGWSRMTPEARRAARKSSRNPRGFRPGGLQTPGGLPQHPSHHLGQIPADPRRRQHPLQRRFR
jgi:hypothetical protein